MKFSNEGASPISVACDSLPSQGGKMLHHLKIGDQEIHTMIFIPNSRVIKLQDSF